MLQIGVESCLQVSLVRINVEHDPHNNGFLLNQALLIEHLESLIKCSLL